MQKIILTLLIASFVSIGFSQSKWIEDQAHSRIGFSITHMLISQTEGQFDDFTITVTNKEEDFSDAQIHANIKVGSINTRNDQRDTHLKSADFFDAEKHPEITFKSTALKKGKGKDKGSYIVTGDLMIKGKTKSVDLKVIYGGTVMDPWGNTKAGFLLSGQINRTDFGIIWDQTLDAGGLILSEEIDIRCNVELSKKE